MKSRWITAGLALLMMAGAASALAILKSKQKLGVPGLQLELPEHVLDFTSTPLEISPVETAILPKDTGLARRLYWQVDGEKTNHILMSVVLMGVDRTSIHQPQFCLTGQGWHIDQTETLRIPIAKPHSYALPVMKLTSTSSQQFKYDNGQVGPARNLYVYWFVADQCLTASHWQRMWLMAKHLLLTGTLQRWAYVSCFAVCPPGQEAATYERMQRFVGAAVPQFQRATLPAE